MIVPFFVHNNARALVSGITWNKKHGFGTVA